MKSYDMTNPSPSKKESDIIKQHKEAKDKTLGKTTKPLEKEDDVELDDIEDDFEEDDEIEDDFDSEDENEIVIEEPPKKSGRAKPSEVQKVGITDSVGAEAKIKNPMWKTNEKRNAKLEKQVTSGKKDIEDLDLTPVWQKPPSRMSTKAWFLTLLILLVPGLNLIMIFVWAFFSDGVPEEKRNFCRASLSMAMILMVLMLIFGFKIGGFGLSFDSIKNKVTSFSEDFKDYTEDSLKDEAGDAMDNYNNLTDDDFTQ